MSNLTISQEQLEFWTNFYINDETTEENLCSWACNKAYLDVCRTIKFKDEGNNNKISTDKKRSYRNKISEIIDKKIESITGFTENTPRETFDKWHKCTCEEIIKNFKVSELTFGQAQLTFGQAQKWLNMTIKYLWLLHSAYEGSENNKFKKYANFMKYSNYFHIPLDSYILDYVKRNYATGNDKIKELTKKMSPWSTIDSPENYYQYQELLADIVKNKQKICNKPYFPIEWELGHWPKALGKK